MANSTDARVTVRQLKALCEQAERLRDQTEKLCRVLTVRIRSSRASLRSADRKSR